MLNNIFLIKLLSIALLIGASYQFNDKSINKNDFEYTVCPDNKMTCKSDQTCCLTNDTFGCCPMKNVKSKYNFSFLNQVEHKFNDFKTI